MDAGDYETNTLLVNNLSSIGFKIYEPVVSQSSVYTFNASDVEFALRNDGHLVYMDVVRRGIWCFYLVRKDQNGASAAPEQSRLGATLEVCGYRLGLVGEGAFEPISLQKSRPPGTNTMNTPSSSSSNNSALDVSARGGGPSYNPPSANSMPSGTMDLDSRVIPTPVVGPDPKGYGSVPVKEMHEFFITAILSSLSTAFCRSSGAISLTPRTMLLPPSTLQPSDSEPVRYPPLSAVASFRVYLTTTGSLVINLSVTAMEGLLSSSDGLRPDWYSAGTPVLAAPLGAFASLQSILDKDHLLPDSVSGQSPETQLSRFRPDVADKLSQWRSHISKLLQLRGMAPSLLDGCSWINIQFLKKKPYEYKADGKRTPMASPAPIVSWPSVLCFRKPSGSLLHELGLEKSSTGDDGDFDPLDSAKSWFEGNAEREELSAKRGKKEHHDLAMRDSAAVDGRQQPRIDPAPLTLRRISNAGAAAAAAAGAMYPTPPDGVQQAPGVTPSFDVVMSSPPNQLTGAALTGSDPVTTMEGRQTRSSSGGWEGDVKREQSVTAYPDGENLFGDIGEDLFENHELTDADFNFFDQDSGDNGLDLSGLSGMGDAMDLSSDLHEAGAGVPHGAAVATEAGPEAPMPPVFAKPELKHARSTLIEENRQPTSSLGGQSGAVAGIKRQPSPFDPDTVYKRVRASLSGRPAIKHFVADKPASRRGSVFEKVDFDPSLSLTNKKYGEKGQFHYEIPSHEETRDATGPVLSAAAVPTIQQRRRRVPKELPGNMKFGELMAKITAGLESNSLNNSPTKADGLFTDDDLSLVSDQDDSSDMTDEPTSPAKYSGMRRPVDDDNLSLAASFRDLEQHTVAESPAYAMADLSRLSQLGSPELPVTKYFADPEPWPLQLSCRDDDFITIAQILTEQAVSGSLVLGPKNNVDVELQETRRSVLNATRHSMQCLRSVLPSSLASAAECQFRPFIEVQDVSLLGQPSRMPIRPAGQEVVRPNLFQIPAPHVELRRYDSKLSVLPSAVSFWEGLGLSPSQGAKDINAICVFPNWKGMQDNAVCFLDRIRSIYESLKMGTFDRLLYGADIPSGLFPYNTEKIAASPLSATAPQPGSALSAAMTKLASDLARLIVTEKNHVVYFVYTPDSPGSIVEACAAFQDLFEKYKKAVADRKKIVSNELVLQLIPLDYVASETSLAILSPSDYAKLCVETYDRCTVFGGPMPAPAIVLEPPLPRGIEFKPTATPSANVLHENSLIHLAYARSVDERWITAAWTDNRGIKQMTASYCLGRRGKPLSNSLEEVTHEIWDTTHDLISMWKVHWRVIITKCGPMEQTEIDNWLALAQSETKASISLTLMTVDTNPSLQLIPPPAKIPVTMSSAFYTTPVSTPQPMMTVSPEQSGGNPPTPINPNNPMTATTPGGESSATEPDADTVLIDVTDTTWGAVVSHRLNNSSSLTELNPAVQSGYLVKRSGVKPEDPPVAMEVNVIHCEGNNPRAYELVLREMLMYFRGLGTLARLRGVVDRETDVRPWHVAAAEKGVRALYQLM
ncbi:mediator complex subunit 13 C-terminal-domain-containing protein [Coniochaeta sp. 2T2.1]|nr:mediator complex subunit 13 C-terminal-domain-containing protein [Coniochaeta sp. 2T2.1]